MNGMKLQGRILIMPQKSMRKFYNIKFKSHHFNTFCVLRYAQVRYVKSLVTNIQKQ